MFFSSYAHLVRRVQTVLPKSLSQHESNKPNYLYQQLHTGLGFALSHRFQRYAPKKGSLETCFIKRYSLVKWSINYASYGPILDVHLLFHVKDGENSAVNKSIKFLFSWHFPFVFSWSFLLIELLVGFPQHRTLWMCFSYPSSYHLFGHCPSSNIS